MDYARSRQAVQHVRKHVTVDATVYPPAANCIAPAPTADPRTWFWCAASGSHGSTQPLTTNGVQSSIRMCTLNSKDAAISRPTVVLPAPEGPVMTAIGATMRAPYGAQLGDALRPDSGLGAGAAAWRCHTIVTRLLREGNG